MTFPRQGLTSAADCAMDYVTQHWKNGARSIVASATIRDFTPIPHSHAIAIAIAIADGIDGKPDGKPDGPIAACATLPFPAWDVRTSLRVGEKFHGRETIIGRPHDRTSLRAATSWISPSRGNTSEYSEARVSLSRDIPSPPGMSSFGNSDDGCNGNSVDSLSQQDVSSRRRNIISEISSTQYCSYRKAGRHRLRLVSIAT